MRVSQVNFKIQMDRNSGNISLSPPLLFGVDKRHPAEGQRGGLLQKLNGFRVFAGFLRCFGQRPGAGRPAGFIDWLCLAAARSNFYIGC